jgi:nucleoside-diphosphate-sugar epimerase
MPVIVVGADSVVGGAILDVLAPRPGEVRAFVTDRDAVAGLRERGVKVAVGDVSDATHVSGASLNVFCGILVAEAAEDHRERSFAASTDAVLAAWSHAMAESEVARVIWVGRRGPAIPDAEVVDVATVGRDPSDVAAEVSRLEAALRI